MISLFISLSIVLLIAGAFAATNTFGGKNKEQAFKAAASAVLRVGGQKEIA